MGLRTIIKNQTFKGQLYNGEDFSGSDTTDNLVGSVGEKIKVSWQIGIDWVSQLSNVDASFPSFTFVYNDQELTIQRDSGSFFDDGFRINDIIDFRYNTSTTSGLVINDLTVLYVESDTIIIDMDGNAPLSGTVEVIRIVGKTELTALNYGFGLIENDENFNTKSKVSQNEQGYYAADIGIDSGSGHYRF